MLHESRKQANGNSSTEKENILAEFAYQPAAEGRKHAAGNGNAGSEKVGVIAVSVLSIDDKAT